MFRASIFETETETETESESDASQIETVPAFPLKGFRFLISSSSGSSKLDSQEFRGQSNRLLSLDSELLPVRLHFVQA